MNFGTEYNKLKEKLNDFNVEKGLDKDDYPYDSWAREMASGNPSELAKEIEAMRFALLKEIKATEKPVTDTTKEKLDNLLHMVIMLDRSNALYNMKLVRDDPKCPNGFLWVTEEDLKDDPLSNIAWSAIQEDGVSVKKTSPRFSITRHYVRFAELNGFDAEWIADQKFFLQPAVPKWIVEHFGDDVVTLPKWMVV